MCDPLYRASPSLILRVPCQAEEVRLSDDVKVLPILSGLRARLHTLSGLSIALRGFEGRPKRGQLIALALFDQRRVSVRVHLNRYLLVGLHMMALVIHGQSSLFRDQTIPSLVCEWSLVQTLLC